MKLGACHHKSVGSQHVSAMHSWGIFEIDGLGCYGMFCSALAYGIREFCGYGYYGVRHGSSVNRCPKLSCTRSGINSHKAANLAGPPKKQKERDLVPVRRS